MPTKLLNLITFICRIDRERLIDACNIAVVLFEVLEAVTNAEGPQVVSFFVSCFPLLFSVILIWT